MQAFGKEVSTPARLRPGMRKPSEALKQIQGARVLLVEDNEINQQVAREILKGAGLHVTVANNGKEAVDAVKEAGYDAVLMDVQMPVMDGYAATRRIRKWEGGRRNSNSEIKSIPIIAMTAHAMAGDEEKSFEAGMNGHVTKPIDPDQLFATLGQWIRPDKKRTQLQRSETKPAVAAEAELPRTLPEFDLALGLQRLQGNRRLYRKLLQDFGLNYAETAPEIRRALEAEDFDRARGLIHNVKGLAGNLAATNLQAAAQDLEKLVKDRSDKAPSEKALSQNFSQFEDALNRALLAVQALGAPADDAIVGSPDAQNPFIPPELAVEIAARLRDASEMGDVTTLTAIAEELKKKSDACIPLSNQIIQLAEDFDFDGIFRLAVELDG
jgi:CheY-like chemotaxis protein